jgi:hypothetical protein
MFCQYFGSCVSYFILMSSLFWHIDHHSLLPFSPLSRTPNYLLKGVVIMKQPALLLVVLIFVLLFPTLMFSHCDTMNGPVVKAAVKALETDNVNLVLIWVQPKDETIIKEAFSKAMKIRSINPDARELADMYFFETLVRVHRAGECEPYTGLKPAKTEVDPGIEAADQAIEKGTTDLLLKHLRETIDGGISKHFKEVVETKGYDKNDLSAGRNYVKNYVTFIHYVEHVHDAATKAVVEH